MPREIGDRGRSAALAQRVAERFELPLDSVDGGVDDVVEVGWAASALICVADSHHVGPEATIRHLVARTSSPVLVAGPHAGEVPFTRLAVCIAGDDFTTHLARAAAAWARSAGALAWLVEVVRAAVTAVPDIIDAAPVRRLAADLARLGVEASWDVVHDGRFNAGVRRATADLPPAVLAVSRADHERVVPGAADRTLRLARHATVPVLVVPPGRHRSMPRWRRWVHAA